jgi:PKHD-type hydroxylase
MILCIGEVLNAEELAELRKLAAEGTFGDGAKTAGWHARLVKHNEQLEGPAGEAAAAKVAAALRRSGNFMSSAYPVKVRPPMISRYEPGQTYGSHVDDAIMGMGPSGARLRTDIAVTLFLSAPEDYEGGELTIDTTAGEQLFKLPAGAMVTYPADSLHRVAPVTRGVRLAAVTWVQSSVRDPAKREILFDLDRTRRALFDKEGKTAMFDTLSKTHANLLRLWAEL